MVERRKSDAKEQKTCRIYRCGIQSSEKGGKKSTCRSNAGRTSIKERSEDFSILQVRHDETTELKAKNQSEREKKRKQIIGGAFASSSSLN